MIPESTLGTDAARPSTVAPQPDLIDDEVVMPSVVDALALDLYVQPVAPIREPEASPLPPAAPAPPEPEPEPELLARLTSPPPPPAPAPSPAPAPAPRPQPLQEELDPEVRALVDELYQQARAELSGDDFGFFAPADDAPGEGPTLAEPPRSEPPLPEPPLMRAQPQADSPAAGTPPPEPDDAPHASAIAPESRGRSAWVPAIQTDERNPRPGQRGASE